MIWRLSKSGWPLSRRVRASNAEAPPGKIRSHAVTFVTPGGGGEGSEPAQRGEPPRLEEDRQAAQPPVVPSQNHSSNQSRARATARFHPRSASCRRGSSQDGSKR